MSTFTLTPLTSAHDTAWDELVQGAVGGNVFQRAEWLVMLGATDKALRVLRLGCFDEKGVLVAGQAVLYQKTWGMAVSVPFEFFYNSLLVAPAYQGRMGEVVALFAAALPHHLAFIQLELHPHQPDARPFLYAGWQVTPRYTYLWDMREPERVWQSMNREKRREIRRVQEKYHFSVAENEADVAEFLPLYYQTMSKFSWWPSPRWETIFQRRMAWMRGRDGCRLHLVRNQAGELIGGVATLISREDGTAYLWRQGSADPAVVPALYWFAANNVAACCPTVNFGGSPQPSLARFKEYLGAVPHLHWQLKGDYSRGRVPLYHRALSLKHRLYNIAMQGRGRDWQQWYHQAIRNKA
ncbi:MAG: GNAT family N-acetyltransferase [Chloroflexi bacterium]|nr:GNAT family N-acetyltransferase [Chloroflexota bacterium]MBP8059087.1 GNAT family N-acetyltransferase [Chloroflexota bacterium]